MKIIKSDKMFYDKDRNKIVMGIKGECDEMAIFFAKVNEGKDDGFRFVMKNNQKKKMFELSLEQFNTFFDVEISQNEYERMISQKNKNIFYGFSVTADEGTDIFILQENKLPLKSYKSMQTAVSEIKKAIRNVPVIKEK